MNSKPQFGPCHGWPGIAAFSEVSDRAFALFHHYLEDKAHKINRPVHHLFLRKVHLAEGTSFSIRLNNSWALHLQALALARVRLEQAIVSSYLLHEGEDVGLRRYVEFIPINDLKHTETALREPGIAEQLRNKVDFDRLRREAIEAQESFTPGFDIDHDRFQRKWTELDLYSMAQRRDDLAKSAGRISRQTLTTDYVSLYKTASSIVHADCSSLSFRFLDLFPFPTGRSVLMALPCWAFIVAAFTACYDTLQCYEVLMWLGIECEDEYLTIQNAWQRLREEYL